MKGTTEKQTAIMLRPCSRNSAEMHAHAYQSLSLRMSKQSGQVLVLTVIMMLVLGIATFILFNTGQLVTRKTQLANAADAAAYSAAVEEARVMNFMAYTNRARIANQVAIAQAVSLVSWMNYARETAKNIARAVRWLRALDVFGPEAIIVVEWLNKIAKAIAQGVRISDTIITGAARTEITSLNKVIGILSGGQNFLIGTLLKKSKGGIGQLELRHIVSAVVYKNDKKASVSYVSSGVSSIPFYRWIKEYFHLYKLGPDHNRFKNVIMEARDGFTRDRSKPRSFVDLPFLKLSLDNAGGTDLLKYNTWSAMDTFAFHAAYPGCPTFWNPLRLCHQEFSIGWGSAQTGKKRSFLKGEVHGRGWKSPYDEKRHRPYGGSLKINKKTTKKARKNSTKRLGRYAGLRRYYDIADTDPKQFNKKNKGYCQMTSGLAGPCITVQATILKKDIKTTQANEGMAGGYMTLTDSEAGKKMAAIASAQVYFYRPYDLEKFNRYDKRQNDSGNNIEYGSLFSPYWQARLVPTPKVARLILIGTQGVSLSKNKVHVDNNYEH